MKKKTDWDIENDIKQANAQAQIDLTIAHKLKTKAEAGLYLCLAAFFIVGAIKIWGL